MNPPWSSKVEPKIAERFGAFDAGKYKLPPMKHRVILGDAREMKELTELRHRAWQRCDELYYRAGGCV
jgi:hypothetical protein